jgi:hypothetical protein
MPVAFQANLPNEDLFQLLPCWLQPTLMDLLCVPSARTDLQAARDGCGMRWSTRRCIFGLRLSGLNQALSLSSYLTSAAYEPNGSIRGIFCT